MSFYLFFNTVLCWQLAFIFGLKILCHSYFVRFHKFRFFLNNSILIFPNTIYNHHILSQNILEFLLVLSRFCQIQNLFQNIKFRLSDNCDIR